MATCISRDNETKGGKLMDITELTVHELQEKLKKKELMYKK